MRHVLLGLSAALLSCGARVLPPLGQLVLYVDTDATVPPAPDTPTDPDRVPAILDRIRFEVFRDGQPVPFGQNARDFFVHEGLFRTQRVSVGIVPPPGQGNLTARIRMFRGDRVVDGEPIGAITLETIIALPPVDPEGRREISVFLAMQDVGKTLGKSAPIAPNVGKPSESRIGSWAGARRVPCNGTLAANEGCVPGGAFLMGDPAFRGRTVDNDMFDERVVVLSPFFLDLTEVTVADMRKHLASLVAGGASAPLPWTQKTDGNAVEDWCSWTEGPSAADPKDEHAALPLNCVNWFTAKAYCESLGKSLPTEAQYEYVMSGLGRELGFPWGDDEPTCEDAVYGRSGFGVLSTAAGPCRIAGTIGGMLPAGNGRLDRIRPDRGREITFLDLGGNMSEWSLDLWSRPDEPFWGPIRILENPIADAASADGDKRTIRGGSWLSTSLSTRASYRLQNPPTDTLRSTGFRCSRSAK